MCMAFFGINRNLVAYLKIELHEDNVTAAAQASAWQGTCYLVTIIGAYVADSYWGNYLTILVFFLIFFTGLAASTLSTSLSILKHSPFPSFVGLYMAALGAGAIKPCLSAFGADQFDNADTTAKGSFFSLYYLVTTIGALLAGTVIVWIQDNCGWTLGFGVPTLLVGIAFICLMGSPLIRMCQV